MNNEFIIKAGVLERYMGTAENVIIPDCVEKIGDNAFAECDRLSLSVNPAILNPGSDIFGSTYGVDDTDKISDGEVDAILLCYNNHQQ